MCVPAYSSSWPTFSLPLVSPGAPEYPCTYMFFLLASTTIYSKQVNVLLSHSVKYSASNPSLFLGILKTHSEAPQGPFFFPHPKLYLCPLHTMLSSASGLATVRGSSHLTMLFYYSSDLQAVFVCPDSPQFCSL